MFFFCFRRGRSKAEVGGEKKQGGEKKRNRRRRNAPIEIERKKLFFSLPQTHAVDK